jgi:hypothetical protein
MTAFRHLKQVPYRRSYNHNGRYYTRYEPGRYDRFGLWSHGDIHFSVDGSLRQTVRRLVHEAEAGATHAELLERLRVRVQNTLLDLLRKEEIARERLQGRYIYLHVDVAVRDVQLQRRREQIAEGVRGEVGDQIAIQVLLVLIRHPGSRPEDTVRLLRGHAPPITMEQVSAVYSRYQLGEKRGPSSC